MTRTIEIPMGKCHTCGTSISDVVHYNIENSHLADAEVLEISAHCGNSGHNLYTGRIRMGEIREAIRDNPKCRG